MHLHHLQKQSLLGCSRTVQKSYINKRENEKTKPKVHASKIEDTTPEQTGSKYYFTTGKGKNVGHTETWMQQQNQPTEGISFHLLNAREKGCCREREDENQKRWENAKAVTVHKYVKDPSMKCLLIKKHNRIDKSYRNLRMVIRWKARKKRRKHKGGEREKTDQSLQEKSQYKSRSLSKCCSCLNISCCCLILKTTTTTTTLTLRKLKQIKLCLKNFV